MNNTFFKFAAVSMATLLGVSCTTTYDTQGRAVQSVSPEGAALGAAAVGLIGYNISKNRYKQDHHCNHGYGYNRGYGYDRGYGHRDQRRNHHYGR